MEILLRERKVGVVVEVSCRRRLDRQHEEVVNWGILVQLEDRAEDRRLLKAERRRWSLMRRAR